MKKYLFGVILVVFFCGCWFGFERYFTPTVSVVMSTYNRSDLLPKAINSVLAQTYDDFEFIIINDGSTDNTVEVLKKYAKQDSRIKIITNSPNQGLITSLNKGLDVARGKYIARLDDDDMAFPNRFEKQVVFLEANPDIAVVGSWVSPIGSTHPYSFQQETDPERIKIMLYLGRVAVSHPSLMLRRDFLNQHNIRYRMGYEAAEDRPFYGEIISAGGQIASIPEPLTHYRNHGSNNPEYYQKQSVNTRRFHVAFINRFFPFNISEPFRKCDLLPKMIVANKTKKLVDQEVLEDIKFDLCGSLQSERVQFVHSFWEDTMIIDNTKIRREQGDVGVITERTPEKIRLKWDDYGEETFIKRQDGIYYLEGMDK